jgi:hypothetical protein
MIAAVDVPFMRAAELWTRRPHSTRAIDSNGVAPGSGQAVFFATAPDAKPPRLRFRLPGGRFRDAGRWRAGLVAVSSARRAFWRRRRVAGRPGCGFVCQAGGFATPAGGGPPRLRLRLLVSTVWWREAKRRGEACG